MAARLVDVLLGGQHGLVGGLDLVAGVGDELVAAARPPRARRWSARSGRAGARRPPARRPTAGSAAPTRCARAPRRPRSTRGRARGPPGRARRRGSRRRRRRAHRAPASCRSSAPRPGRPARPARAARGRGCAARAAAACSMARRASFGLGVGGLGVAQGLAGRLELAAQRRLVELGRLEVARAGGPASSIIWPAASRCSSTRHQLAVGGLDVGAAGVEVAPGLLGGVGELAGPLEQARRSPRGGRDMRRDRAAASSRRLAVDGLQLAGATQAGRPARRAPARGPRRGGRPPPCSRWRGRRGPNAMLRVVGASCRARAAAGGPAAR